MEYINFIDESNPLVSIEGSDMETIEKVEIELGYSIPKALKEYLMLMGEKTNFYEYWDEHGTREILKLNSWLYEWINKYRSEGIQLEKIKDVLSFFNFQDTFFYIPIEAGNENPSVYAFDINDTPTIRKLNDSFTDFVRWKYSQLI